MARNKLTSLTIAILSIFIAVFLSGSGCGILHTEAIKLHHPKTNITVQCGPYEWHTHPRVRHISQPLAEKSLYRCLSDYQSQGYVRSP